MGKATDKFNAILSKNEIARELKRFKKWATKYCDYTEIQECPLNSDYILSCLDTIEYYLGEANQPSIKDIMESKKYEL